MLLFPCSLVGCETGSVSGCHVIYGADNTVSSKSDEKREPNNKTKKQNQRKKTKLRLLLK